MRRRTPPPSPAELYGSPFHPPGCRGAGVSLGAAGRTMHRHTACIGRRPSDDPTASAPQGRWRTPHETLSNLKLSSEFFFPALLEGLVSYASNLVTPGRRFSHAA